MSPHRAFRRGAASSRSARLHADPVGRLGVGLRAGVLSLALAVVVSLAGARAVEVARAHLVGSLGPASADLTLGDLISLKGAVTAGDAERARAILAAAGE